MCPLCVHTLMLCESRVFDAISGECQASVSQASGDEGGSAQAGYQVVDMKHSPKLLVLLELLTHSLRAREKVLVFSQSLVMLDLIEHALLASPHPDPSPSELAVAARAAGPGRAPTGPNWRRNHFCRLDGQVRATRLGTARILVCMHASSVSGFRR